MPTVNDIAPIYADEQTGEDDLYLPQQRPKKDTRSKLMKSKAAAAGLIVNACPFGCEDHQLDEQQYCRHLVGFTDPNDERIFFPMVLRPDPTRPDRPGRFRFVDGENPEMLKPGDRLVRITVCSRVYREQPEATHVAANLRIDETETANAAEQARLDRMMKWAEANGFVDAAPTAQTETTDPEGAE